MEDQEVQSPPNFLVKKFFFLQHDDRTAFKCVLTTDRRFESAFRLKETKVVHYYFAADLNFWNDWQSHGR